MVSKTIPSFITLKLREGLEAIRVDKDMAGDVAELLNVASQIVATGGLGANSSKFAAKAEKIVDESQAVKVLPRSEPIIHAMGAASRAEMLAEKLKLNINSPTTRQGLNSLGDNVDTFIRNLENH